MKYQAKRDNNGKFIPVILNRIKICKFCGKEFTPPIKNFARDKFCSRSCASKSHPSGRLGKKNSQYQKDMVRLKMSGILHPRWIKDRTEILENKRLRCSIRWKVWRGEVFKRDNYTCQECHIYGVPLEPHHIIPRRENKERIFDTSNGITLCRPCHQNTIWKEKKFQKKYFSIIKHNTPLSK
jgi:hypothetical protein